MLSSKLKYSYRTITIHLISCVAFLFLPLISSPRASFFDSFTFGPPEIRGMFNSFLLILFFYFHYLVLLPKLLYKKKYVLWFIVVLISFAIITFLPRLIFSDSFHPKPIPTIEMHGQFKPDFPKPHHEMPNGGKENFFRMFLIQESVLKFLFVILLSFFMKTNQFWKESREEKRKAELMFLKSQVNPHFLFNTLNGIYALSIEKSEETTKSIIKLSELMRYVINEIDKDGVLLTDEVNYLKNYIDLQQLRFGETVKINFQVSDFNLETSISPLLFINFVENAFKHGIDVSKVSEIDIQLKTVGNDLFFSVKNQKSTQDNDSDSLQKGLENVIRRLELEYPQSHELNIINTENDYCIELTMKDIV